MQRKKIQMPLSGFFPGIGLFVVCGAAAAFLKETRTVAQPLLSPGVAGGGGCTEPGTPPQSSSSLWASRRTDRHGEQEETQGEASEAVAAAERYYSRKPLRVDR